ncbi:TRAP transporter small permease [Petroclostridium sp. X23]|uniref:TRAP transporter small permease n=1 Tax=Petroclostridium sp. X23 TaxID=3045146 RepID=UPI0024AE056C|nr:TRAP transporter small permease [Petroclostridium sp. X23]WHH57331.1 TRAP transporter small permease [Petroclostridium sp. X23]
MNSLIKKLSDMTNFIAVKISLVLIIALTILTTMGVVYRYVLQMPLVWLYETSVVIFAWMIFLGASIAFKQREHIKLEFLVSSVPENVARMLKIIIEIITIAFLVFVIKEGFEIVKNTWNQTYNTINLSTAWFYLSFPVSAVFMVIHLIEAVLELLFEKNTMAKEGQ